MKEPISFAEQFKKQTTQSGVDALDVLTQRLPVFFQGMAALTGMRCQRENLKRCSCWDEALHQKQLKANLAGENRPLYCNFRTYLVWGVSDLIMENDAEVFSCLLLEPMFQLEEYECAQKGAL